jgi:hypothetical protein
MRLDLVIAAAGVVLLPSLFIWVGMAPPNRTARMRRIAVALAIALAYAGGWLVHAQIIRMRARAELEELLRGRNRSNVASANKAVDSGLR